jgi:hypothetical protein
MVFYLYLQLILMVFYLYSINLPACRNRAGNYE